jgi:putative transposase
MVTAGTYLKAHHFRGPERCAVLHRGLLKTLQESGWQLEAWAVFSNHYHFVGHSPPTGAAGLSETLAELHSRTATWLNRLEGKSKRKVWHNFWDTRLTFEKAYLARLSYVHRNPVHHGLVPVANQYPWGSAAWLERVATRTQIQTIYGIRIDSVSVLDSYAPLMNEW